MKVILADYNERMTVSDELLKDGLTEEQAKAEVLAWNKANLGRQDKRAVMVPDEYALWSASDVADFIHKKHLESSKAAAEG